MLLGFLSARGILETATGLVSPELFLVQDSSELKTLIAENSSLNGTLLILSGAITLAFALFVEHYQQPDQPQGYLPLWRCLEQI